MFYENLLIDSNENWEKLYASMRLPNDPSEVLINRLSQQSSSQAPEIAGENHSPMWQQNQITTQLSEIPGDPL